MHDRGPGQYEPSTYVQYGLIPLLGGAVGVFVVAFIGVIDRISAFRSAPNPIPLTDLAVYAAIAFASGFGLLLLKALIWPWK
jgi:hypothetical protein